jgi:hypothetical protein
MLRGEVLPPAIKDLDPALFLSLHFAQSPTLNHGQAGNARLTWATARIGACPLRWPARARVGLRPCLAFEGGVLHGRGSQTIHADTWTAPWLALDALVDWELVIGKYVTLGADGGATLPLYRSRFFFAGSPEETVFHVPAIGLVADVHLGIRFP